MVDKKKSSKSEVEVASAPKAPSAAEKSSGEPKPPKASKPKLPKAGEPKLPKAVVAPAAPAPKARPVLVSFARWFATRSKEKGWKSHWVAGMKAYANTAGRLPMAGWDELFRNY